MGIKSRVFYKIISLATFFTNRDEKSLNKINYSLFAREE